MKYVFIVTIGLFLSACGGDSSTTTKKIPLNVTMKSDNYNIVEVKDSNKINFSFDKSQQEVYLLFTNKENIKNNIKSKNKEIINDTLLEHTPNYISNFNHQPIVESVADEPSKYPNIASEENVKNKLFYILFR